MREIKNQKNNGFTLIELLVVIAIIALLATVVLASLGESREKAQNAKRNKMAIQYINALELYRDSNNGSYPNTGETFKCIGWGDGESCYGGAYSGENDLNNALDPYIPGPPKNDASLEEGGFNWSGTLYKCVDIDCSNIEIRWIVSDDVKCSVGATSNPFGDPELGFEGLYECIYN